MGSTKEDIHPVVLCRIRTLVGQQETELGVGVVEDIRGLTLRFQQGGGGLMRRFDHSQFARYGHHGLMIWVGLRLCLCKGGLTYGFLLQVNLSGSSIL